MEGIEDREALRAGLRPLAERRLVVYLTPEGRRGTILTHGFHSPAELERSRESYPGQDDTPEPTTEQRSAVAAGPALGTFAASGMAERLEEARAEIAALRA